MDEPKWGMRAPKLLNAHCWGWSRYPGNGRDGWALDVRLVNIDDPCGYRYFSANYRAGKGGGYYFYEVTKGGREYNLISGPYKRLDDVQRAGIDHLIELYWLAPN